MDTLKDLLQQAKDKATAIVKQTPIRELVEQREAQQARNEEARQAALRRMDVRRLKNAQSELQQVKGAISRLSVKETRLNKKVSDLTNLIHSISSKLEG